MKIRKIVSALFVSAIVVTSSINVLAAEGAYEGIEFSVADRVVITENGRGVDMTFGEGKLNTGFYSNGKAVAYAVTNAYSGNYHLRAQAMCYDQYGNFSTTPIAYQEYATSVISGLVSPKETYGGDFYGDHSITSPVTGESHSGSTYTRM